MESQIVVRVAGRCAERLLLGDGAISSVGAEDLDVANGIAKAMIYRCGFSKRLGPVPLMDGEDYSDVEHHQSNSPANISTELARYGYTVYRTCGLQLPELFSDQNVHSEMLFLFLFVVENVEARSLQGL